MYSYAWAKTEEVYSGVTSYMHLTSLNSTLYRAQGEWPRAPGVEWWVPMAVFPEGLMDLNRTSAETYLADKGPSSQSYGWVFFRRTDAKAETPVLWPPHKKS